MSNIKICQLCRNTGAVGERYCSCESAMALRARIDADPRMQELRAKIERLLGDPEPTIMVIVGPGVRVLHRIPEPHDPYEGRTPWPHPNEQADE